MLSLSTKRTKVKQMKSFIQKALDMGGQNP